MRNSESGMRNVELHALDFASSARKSDFCDLLLALNLDSCWLVTEPGAAGAVGPFHPVNEARF